MNPHLPLHVRVPDHCTIAQHVSITTQFIRFFRTWQHLPNTTLATIYRLYLGKGDSQQQRHTVVVCFRGQIRGLQLRDTIEMHSLKSTAQLFCKLVLYIGIDILTNRESLIRLNLLCCHHQILFIQEEERRVTMRLANARAQPSLYFW